MADDMRYYETFYGIHVEHWGITFGGSFSDHKYILSKTYINEGCECEETKSASGEQIIEEFIFPHHIAKTYFIEGVISGHFTIAASTATAEIEQYKVSLYKIHESTGVETLLFTTGWQVINDSLEWDSTYSIGEEKVYPFWIDAWEKVKLTEFERFYVKIEIDCNNYTVLWHSNDATWEDFKIEIPFIM